MSAKDRSQDQVSEEMMAEAEALIWGLLDENIDAVSMERLEQLLGHAEIRKRYVQCIELHSDLQQLFQPEANSLPPRSPVLGSLGDVFPPSGTSNPSNSNHPSTE